MATTISKLAIKLVADANGVRTGTLGAEQALTRLRRRIDVLSNAGYERLKASATSTFGQILSAQAAVAAGTQAWHATVDQLADAYQRVDERMKRARQLGGEAQDLGRLEFAAARTTVLDPDKVFDAVRAMNKRISDARLDPQGELAKSLAKLDLDAAELSALSLTDRFLELGEAIAELPNPEDRAAFAARFFEETGSGMVNAFTAGRASLEALFDEYDRLHGRTTQLDAEAIEGFNDAVGKLTIAFEGMWEAAAAENADELQKSVEAVTDLVIFLRDNVEQLSQAWYYLSASQLGWWRLAEAAGEVSGFTGETAEATKKLEQAMTGARGAQESSIEAYERQQALADDLKEAEEARLKILEEAARQQESWLDAQMQAMERLVGKADDVRDALKDPFEKLREELVETLRLVDHKLLDQLDFEAFATQKGQALLDSLLAEEQRAGGFPDSRLASRGVGSVVAGSQEALSAIAANERGLQQQAQRDQYAARQRDKQLKTLQRIERIIQQPRGPQLLPGELN